MIAPALRELLHHYDQMVGDLNRARDMQSPANQDLRQVILRVRDQSVRIQVSAKGECVESHSPKGLQLESLRQGDEVQLSELLAHDRA